MRSTMSKLGLGVVGLMMVGCATAGPVTRSLGRPYTEAEVETIMHLRDNGDGLLDVAGKVGGTRQEVRRAELEEKARRRGGSSPMLFASQGPAGQSPSEYRRSP
jgi:hypothetical protein